MNRSREYNGPLPQRARAIGRLSGYDYINTGRRSSNNKYRTEISSPERTSDRNVVPGHERVRDVVRGRRIRALGEKNWPPYRNLVRSTDGFISVHRCFRLGGCVFVWGALIFVLWSHCPATNSGGGRFRVIYRLLLLNACTRGARVTVLAVTPTATNNNRGTADVVKRSTER